MRCGTHSITTIPTKQPRRRLAVVSYLAGGLAVVDVGNPDTPKEAGFYVDTVGSEDPDLWAATWFNGRIHTTERDSLHGVGSFVLDKSTLGAVRSFRKRHNPGTMLRDFDCGALARGWGCSGSRFQRRAH